MKRHGKNVGRRLDEAFRRFDQISEDEIAEAQKQTLEYLELQTRAHAEERMQDSQPVRFPRTSQSFRFAAVAVVAVAAVTLSTAFVRTHWRSDQPAVVQTAGGDLFRVSGETLEVLRGGASLEFGETIRTSGRSGTILSLKDGSAVEMRPKSDLTLEAANDGLRIRLNAGNIIVTAAKQRDGHLYVQTKDMTVSVVGTLFLVNAEEEGSRVAVIEGEVRVQHGPTERTLLPGQQLATNPSMEKLSVSEGFSWGQNAEVILPVQRSAGPAAGTTQEPPETFEAILARLSEMRQVLDRVRQSNTSSATTTQKAPEEFDVASIRRTIATQMEGTRGGGGTNTSGFASNGIGDPCTPNRRFQVDPSRLFVNGGTLYGLIAVAYTNRCLPDLLFGGPEWAKTDQYDVQAVIPAGSPVFTTQDLIDGDAPALQKMMQSLLADRFKLKLRFEMREMSAYNMVVADPEKLKQWFLQDIADRKGPQPRTTIFTTYAAPGTLKAWAKGINVGRPVIDKTGLTGLYEFRLEYPSLTQRPRGIDGLAALIKELPSLLPKAMESQLGLKLEPTVAPVQVIVIESAERPSEN